MLARLRRHLLHTVEIAHAGEPALASFRELARVEACQRLARASGFRLLGAQRVTLAMADGRSKLPWIRERWVLDEVTLTITDTFYCFTTRWPDHVACTFSNPYPLSRSHVGFEVHPGSGAGFATDLAEHRAKVARASETHGAPTRVRTLEDEDACERRYYLEQMPLDRLLVTPPGIAWWTKLWIGLVKALLLTLLLLSGLHASGLSLAGPSTAGWIYGALALGAVAAFFVSEAPVSLLHHRHFHDRAPEAERAGVANAKELSIATFKQAVMDRPRGRAARSCPLCRDELLGLETVSCLGCGTIYHDLCATEFARCSTLGCREPFPIGVFAKRE